MQAGKSISMWSDRVGGGSQRPFYPYWPPPARAGNLFAFPRRRPAKTTVILPSRRADSPEKRSFCQIRARKCQNDGLFAKPAGGFAEKTVFSPHRRADRAKKLSFSGGTLDLLVFLQIFKLPLSSAPGQRTCRWRSPPQLRVQAWGIATEASPPSTRWRGRPRLRVQAPSRCVPRSMAGRRHNPPAGRLRHAPAHRGGGKSFLTEFPIPNT